MESPARDSHWTFRPRNQLGRFASFACQASRTITAVFLKSLAVLMFAFGAAGALAQPLKFIVPFVPGSSGDLVARILAQKITESSGNQTIVENRPGAGGLIGLEALVQAAEADHTLGLLSTSTLVAALRFQPNLLDRLQRVGPVGISGMVIVSTRDASIAALAERVRQAPQMSLGSSGEGSLSQLCISQFVKEAGRKSPTEIIPYKGSAPLLADLVAGHVDAACVEIYQALPHVLAGKLRALALTLHHPDEQLPGVPTLESAKVHGILPATWYAVVVPKGMSRKDMDSIASLLGKAFTDPQTQGYLRNVLTAFIPADRIAPGSADPFIQSQIAQLRSYASTNDKAVGTGASMAMSSPEASNPATDVRAAIVLTAPKDTHFLSAAVATPEAVTSPGPQASGAGTKVAEATSAAAKPAAKANISRMEAALIAGASECEGQCARLLADAKCKKVKGAQENLSCIMQNGYMRPDTPQLCAEAKALNLCVAKRDKESAAMTLRSGGSYDSVCERNRKKIDQVMQDSKLIAAGATYDLFMKDAHWNIAKLHEPCMGSDAKAAQIYKSEMETYNKVSEYCAGPHRKYECTRWGAEGGVSDNGGNPYNNPAWYAKWKSEVDKALSNPDYSADLGPVSGSGAVNGPDDVCAASLKKIESQYEAAKREIPAKSIVVLSEATMWMAAKSIEAIKSQCPKSDRYRTEVGRLESQHRDIKRACDASASTGVCVARLPSSEPVTQAGNTLPPLRKDSLKEDCSGPNWIQCRKKECKDRQGEFHVTKGGCAVCYVDGGNWTKCLPGSGGVSSGQ